MTAPSTHLFDNPGKLAAYSALLLLVCIGLCGVSIKLYPDDYVTYPGLATLAGMFAGVIGLVIALIQAIIKAAARKDKS